MIDFIRRNIALIAALLLAWFSWSDYSVETKPKKAEAKTIIPDFGPNLLHVRNEDEPAPVLANDPYRFDEARRLAELEGEQAQEQQAAAAEEAQAEQAARQAVPVADPTATAAAFESSVRSLVGDGLRGFGAALGTLVERVEAGPAPAFTVNLESILAVAGGGQARLNGRTVQVGEAIPGLDPESPPVLYAVEGTTAVLRHRGELHVLDLLSDPYWQVGGPAPATPDEPSGEQAAGSPTPLPSNLTPKQRAAASAKATAKKAAPAPADPNPVKPKGKVRRVRGKLPGHN